ncbi:hypothetical protein C8R43DRAFT_965367 [Mycena crocata]|nr:hypothetical protein C8R43DRAFT_965367 [Mycena crocata]
MLRRVVRPVAPKGPTIRVITTWPPRRPITTLCWSDRSLRILDLRLVAAPSTGSFLEYRAYIPKRALALQSWSVERAVTILAVTKGVSVVKRNLLDAAARPKDVTILIPDQAYHRVRWDLPLTGWLSRECMAGRTCVLLTLLDLSAQVSAYVAVHISELFAAGQHSKSSQLANILKLWLLYLALEDICSAFDGIGFQSKYPQTWKQFSRKRSTLTHCVAKRPQATFNCAFPDASLWAKAITPYARLILHNFEPRHFLTVMNVLPAILQPPSSPAPPPPTELLRILRTRSSTATRSEIPPVDKYVLLGPAAVIAYGFSCAMASETHILIRRSLPSSTALHVLASATSSYGVMWAVSASPVGLGAPSGHHHGTVNHRRGIPLRGALTPHIILLL